MKSEWITGLAIFIMLSSLIVGTAIYYKDEVNQCTSNPLSYGAKQMENDFGFEFVGTGYFISPIGIGTPVITFDKQNVSIK